MKKVQLTKAQQILRLYATAVNKLQPAYSVILAFAQAEVSSLKGSYDEKKAAIVAKFDAALAGLDNARDTLRVYLGDACAIACVPDVVVKVKAEGAKIGEKATEELTVAKMASKRDMQKLAAGAREKLGITKVRGSGRQAAPVAAPSTGTIEAHVRSMMKVPEGRALLQKWAASEGIWLDFKEAEKVAVVAPESAKPEVKVSRRGKAKAEVRVQ